MVDALDTRAAVQIEALKQPRKCLRIESKTRWETEGILHTQNARPVCIRFPSGVAILRASAMAAISLSARVRSDLVGDMPDARFRSEFQL